LANTKKIKFSNNDSQFLACYNIDEAVIINLKGGLEGRIVSRFKCNEKHFEGIFHLQIASIEPADDDDLMNFRCEIACLSANTD
jgi:hypothetical protein